MLPRPAAVAPFDRTPESRWRSRAARRPMEAFLSRRGSVMVVREVMTRNAATIGADETLEAAARKMRELGIGALPVLDRGQLAGIVTDRDLTVRAVAAGADPTRTPVREAMTAQVIACREDDDVEEAARRMEQRAVRRIMVLDREGALSGMLSVEDLVSASMALAADVLRHAREPGLPA